MFRLTIKSLLANKVRFALTTFGVMLAVSFVVFGAIAGTVYELLEVEAFVPIEPSAAAGDAA